MGVLFFCRLPCAAVWLQYIDAIFLPYSGRLSLVSQLLAFKLRLVFVLPAQQVTMLKGDKNTHMHVNLHIRHQTPLLATVIPKLEPFYW